MAIWNWIKAYVFVQVPVAVGVAHCVPEIFFKGKGTGIHSQTTS